MFSAWVTQSKWDGRTHIVTSHSWSSSKPWHRPVLKLPRKYVRVNLSLTIPKLRIPLVSGFVEPEPVIACLVDLAPKAFDVIATELPVFGVAVLQSATIVRFAPVTLLAVPVAANDGADQRSFLHDASLNHSAMPNRGNLHRMSYMGRSTAGGCRDQ